MRFFRNRQQNGEIEGAAVAHSSLCRLHATARIGDSALVFVREYALGGAARIPETMASPRPDPPERRLRE